MESQQDSQTGQRQSEPLALISLIASVGSVAFLAAPMMLGAFAFLIALAGMVCGFAAGRRGGGGMATAGAIVGALMTLLYASMLLG